MDIKEAVDNLIQNEVEKQTKPIQDTVRKEVHKLLASKGFKANLKKTVREHVFNMLDEDGPLAMLPQREQDDIIKKAVRAVFTKEH